METREPEVARFFTAARRFSKLLGKLPDGTRIPGGPYTIVQGVVVIVAAAGALMTRGHLWTFGSFLIDVPMALAVAAGLGILAGRIPTRNRNLATIALSAIHAMSSPAVGRRNGKTVTIRKPRKVGGGAVIDWPVSEAELDEIESTDTPVPVPQPAAAPPAPVTAVTGVERLLQQTRAK